MAVTAGAASRTGNPPARLIRPHGQYARTANPTARLAIADGEPQAGADRDNGLGQRRLGLDQRGEGRQLVRMRLDVVDREEALRGQRPDEIAQVAGVGRPLGIEEDELPFGVVRADERLGRILGTELDERFETGDAEVLARQLRCGSGRRRR